MIEKTYEKQVKIEHIKLSIIHAIFSFLELIFFFLTICTLPLIALLGNWAGNSFKLKIIGMTISFLYFFVTCVLTILFQNIAFNNKDDFMISGHTRNFDTIWKYKSEILAEKKLRKKGVLANEQPTEHSQSESYRAEEQNPSACSQSET